MSRPRQSPRRRSREAALQILYALDLSGEEEAVSQRAQEAFEDAAANFELPEGARAFAKELVLGVANRCAELDALLGQFARNWRVERMAAVDRNVLRIAAYELMETEAPAPVIIDQAVELAHRFGAEGSPAFVNGVLDAVAHSVRPPETHSVRPSETRSVRPSKTRSVRPSKTRSVRPPETRSVRPPETRSVRPSKTRSVRHPEGS